MRKHFLTLLMIIFCSFVYSQDLKDLTPEQIKYYRQQYLQGENQTNNSNYEESGTRQVQSSDSIVNRDEIEDNDYQYNRIRNFDQNKYSGNKYIDSRDYKDYLDFLKWKKKNNEKNKLSVFGMFLFNSFQNDGTPQTKGKTSTFEPQINIPTPTNYILGTYDQLSIVVSGNYQRSFNPNVSPEGYILVPNIGPVKVGGLTIEAATVLIKNHLEKIYHFSTGQTKLNVSLGKIRSIKISVIGEAVRPGTYTLPSLATVFNALYACGGPSETGSMRSIKIFRNGKQIGTLDLYKFLVEGVLNDNVVLQDQDVVKIEPYKLRVYVNGAVKHKAIFEAVDGENIQNLIYYAGGFSEIAYKKNITIYRNTNNGKSILDINDAQLSKTLINAGDSICIPKILNIYENKVDIAGAIFHPGSYALEPAMTVGSLIKKADGLKEEAYLSMAYLTRKQKNKVPEIIGFDLGKLTNGEISDIPLQKDDSLVIRSVFEMKFKEMVSISGEVKRPGDFDYTDQMTVKDLIFKAMGFTEFASTDSIELVRPIKDPDSLLFTNIKSRVFKISMDKDLKVKEGSENMKLMAGDQVIIRSISGYEGVRMVRVEGEVINPGGYNITNKAEKISDVIRRAGGFTKYAYPKGASLIRTENLNSVEVRLSKIMQENTRNLIENQKSKSIDKNLITSPGGISNIDSLQKKLSGSEITQKILNNENIVGIDLDEIMKTSGSKLDLKIEEGDIIYVPRELQTVKVKGRVLFPTMVRYEQGLKLKDYVSNSGGFAKNADKSKVFVLYPNGSAKSTGKFLFFRVYPKVKPGSIIVVPENPTEVKSKISPAETVAILTSVTACITLMYSILKK